MNILGVDPGLSGALALWDTDRGELFVIDMPVLEIVRNRSKRHALDGHALWRELSDSRADHAFIEEAQAMPKQSTYATGVFYQTYGMVLGLLVAARIPYTVVHPRVWKRALGVNGGKEGSRQRASELFPGQRDNWWPLKKHDGRAESSLIALYGARQLLHREAA